MLVSNFASADRNDLVFRLAELAPEISDDSDIVTQTLIQSLGRELIGAPGGADTWSSPDGINYPMYQQYKLFANRANATGYPELYLAFEMILRDMSGEDKSVIVDLIHTAEDLEGTDRANFESLMYDLSYGRFTIDPDAESARISQKVKEFIDKYSDETDIFPRIDSEDTPL